MNPLDKLLSETARVDDITRAALHNNRATLDSVIATFTQAQPVAPHPLHYPNLPARRRRRTGAFIAASVAAAAALVAGTTVTVLSSHSHSNSPQAGHSHSNSPR